jgi:hypothetical protein
MEEVNEQEKKYSDPKQRAASPGLMPYAHSVGSAIIRPVDAGRTRGIAMRAMYEQTENQLGQIRKQVEMLIGQAQEIHDRIKLSEIIYQADLGFKPVIGHTYHLYRRTDGKAILSLVAPEEWGIHSRLTYLATAKLLADHTWDILTKADDFYSEQNQNT